MERDYNVLTQTDLQVNDRMTKTLAEKNKLQQVTNSGNNKMLSEAVYAKLSKEIFKIYKQVKPAPAESGEVPPLNQLLEIERFLEDCEKFLNEGTARNKTRIELHMKTIKTEAKAKRKMEQERMRIQAEQFAQEERRRKDASRIVKVGGKVMMPRSEKPFFKKITEDKRDLTQEQEDQLKYLGDFAMPVPPKL